MIFNHRPPGVTGLLDAVLSWVALIGGGLTLAFMTLFSVWNVLIMRKALNNPIVGAEDLLVLSLVAVVALAIPFGARSGAHIEIEVLESAMSQGFARWSMIFVKLLGLALLVVMAQQLWHAGDSAERFGETTQQLLISYQPFYYMLAISIALYAVVLVLDIVRLMSGRAVSLLRIDGDLQ
ncbi:TRAP-type C4-dicarboxylate transport system, small permease component [Phaeobacter sp. CECT 5382]|uniref:TRAP transporter small permease n=1 Tax=Phaeobacter sp. CECT 5382 TaxID=1712645 RepID=UPI0006D99B92|nr:TRAP transporter small permease [Phaeobacter sp. CECT 5382]CUH88867.1 TRAP-type C4-dicarboxylate transport system, small permease component [Phaeobacter sp. CECT 5382]